MRRERKAKARTPEGHKAIKRKESPDWNVIFDNYARPIIENDLDRYPLKIKKYRDNPTSTMQQTIRTYMIRERKHLIKNVDREGMVINADKMKSQLKSYLGEEEFTPIEVMKGKQKGRILSFKKGRRGIFGNYPSLKAFKDTVKGY